MGGMKIFYYENGGGWEKGETKKV